MKKVDRDGDAYSTQNQREGFIRLNKTTPLIVSYISLATFNFYDKGKQIYHLPHKGHQIVSYHIHNRSMPRDYHNL